MSQNTYIIGILLVGGVLLLNSGGSTPPVAAEQSVTESSRFDYGDGEGTAPDDSVPVEPFKSTPPVIDGTDAVAAADTTAFSDVAPEKVEDKVEPVASTPPADPPSAFEDVVPPPQEPAGPVASAPPVAGPDWTQNVFPIQCNNNAGCAVAVGPSTLLTVHHVAKYSAAQVSTQGQWVNGTVTLPPQADDILRDGSIITVAGGQFPSMRIRTPVYYEPVTVYGLKTKVKQRGYISAARFVSLPPGSPGVVSGDSGGAVVADDGCLVGLISGHEGQVTTVPGNTCVVAITRMDYLAPYVPRQGMSATAPSNGVPRPVGSVFPGTADQPSAFDDVPAVNKNQVPVQSNQSCTTGNCATPQQMYYYRSTPRQRRGFFK